MLSHAKLYSQRFQKMTLDVRNGLLVAIAVGSFGAGTEAQTPYSIQDILSAPFATDLVAAPSGAAFAWIRYEQGARNIWVAEGPDFVGRKLTDWSDDDGQDLLSLHFTPDARRIIFVRGGGPNRSGEIPNPRSEPEPATQTLWVTSLDGRTQAIADGASPAIKPDGRTLAFIRRGQVFATPLTGRADPTPLFTIRGSAGSLTWSPTGDKLAFVSNRGDHSFVGVFDLQHRTVRYLDPSLDRDGSPTWSPDGSEIAFLRIPNRGGQLPFSPVRSALPWSIRIANASSGTGREIWKATPGEGSAFHGVTGPQLVWLSSDHLVFPWERQGWTQLYSVPLTGGGATLLTPGDFEVEHVLPSTDGRQVYFSSNEADIDRRHLWRVTTDEAPEAVTFGDGIEWGPAVTADGQTLAFLASDATTPAHAEVLPAGGTRRPLVHDFMPNQFPHQEMVTPKQVVFESEDLLPIHGQLFLPPEINPEERNPAIIFFHGGSRRQMLLGWHYLRYYHNAYALNQYFASRGYVVLSVNYRSGTGYGMEFREALDYGARGASEYRDVVAAGLFLGSRSDVDPNRIALWGGSYGGYLTALGLARNSDLFAAGVDIHGCHDWNVCVQNFVPSYQPEQHEEFARLAYESSPMGWIDGWRSPVLLIHGDDDRNVPFSESVDLLEMLRQRGVEVEQLVFPDEVHGFLLHRNWLAAFKATADFMKDRLNVIRTSDNN